MKKKLFTAASVLMIVGGAMAVNEQTVTFDGQTVDQKATAITFEGDNVIVAFADGTNRKADMESVKLAFKWDSNIAGDVNGDKAVDVADIATIISVMAGDDTHRANADVNGDKSVDVADIASVISIMAGGEAQVRRAEAATPRTWDFTQTIDSDLQALKAATTEWLYTEKSNRYENIKAINGPLTAGQTVLELTQGLSFKADSAKIRIDVGKRVQLAGKNVTVTSPQLKKGQRMTITFASTGDKAVTFDVLTNLTDAQGFKAADKNTTQTGTATVEQDGTVSFACSGGSVNIFSITISDATEKPIEPETPADNTVQRSTKKNQAVVTLTSGDVKYYNTDDINHIGIDDAKGIITFSMANQQEDVYSATVGSISFTKKEDTGQNPSIDNKGVVITEAQGWQESLYAKWELQEEATGYNVYVRSTEEGDWTKIDDQLVRNYGTYGRADVVGLAAGTYELKVVATKDGEESNAVPSTVSDLVVRNYDRTGYAHFNHSGVGAYNDDGTLKSGAKVFYVTAKTAKTISTTVAGANQNPCTGIQQIIEGYEKGQDTTPIAFRFIGKVSVGDLDFLGSSEEGIQVKGRKADSELNLTFEGIGEDATIFGFGFLLRNTKSVEFRNLAIMRCMDDGISMDTNNSNVWVHNCDFFYGKHGSGDHDKGDGALDVKSDSKYVTTSYNRYWDTGKTNMYGMKSESGPNYISYHHNWFDHSDSRHPRVRTMSVHVWNNYFDNVAKYGVGACTGSSVFVENNYFLKTKKPILISMQGTDGLGSGTFSSEDGGMIKAYGNYFDRSAVHFSYYTQRNPSSKGYDAYETGSRDEQVPSTEVALQGGTSYNNFDTDPKLIYEYTPDAAADVPAIVTGYYGAGRLNHGDFSYTFSDNVGSDDEDSAYDTTLGALLDSYEPALVGFFGKEEDQGGDTGGVDVNPEPPVQEGTILASFDGTPSNSMFTVVGDYGDGKITYEGTYYKKGAKLNSKGSVTFTPKKNYQMTLVLATAKTGRNVGLNSITTTVGGNENTEGKYYEMEPISITAGTQYTLTKGSAESILMLIKLVPEE